MLGANERTYGSDRKTHKINLSTQALSANENVRRRLDRRVPCLACSCKYTTDGYKQDTDSPDSEFKKCRLVTQLHNFEDIRTSSPQIALVAFALGVSKIIALVVVQGQTQLALKGANVVPHYVRVLQIQQFVY